MKARLRRDLVGSLPPLMFSEHWCSDYNHLWFDCELPDLLEGAEFNLELRDERFHNGTVLACSIDFEYLTDLELSENESLRR